jgi:hypothetical protein
MDNREKHQITIKHLMNHSFPNSINGKNDRCGQIFAGCIRYASMVFTSHLILGGSYRTNEEDKKELCELLKRVNQILDKYEIREYRDYEQE